MKLLSVNIEQDHHLDAVRDFIEQESADIVALLEVCEDNLDKLLPAYPHRIYAPNFHMDGRKIGVVIAARTELHNTSFFYADGKDGLDVPPHGRGTHRPVAVSAKIGDILLTAVHFTWTENGSSTQVQRDDLGRLLGWVGDKEQILCGDFNIARGNESYQMLAAKYTDTIPPDITSTLDPHLHRVNRDHPGTLAFVVDYIWSTARYCVSNVRIVDGVSDHCGIVAHVDIV